VRELKLQLGKKPKYAKHVFKRVEIPIDSISFRCHACGVMNICDQSKNEDPRMRISWINYPREKRIQLRLACLGKFHIEKPKYYVIDPDIWKESNWIILPREIIDKVKEILEKDPFKLASWM